MDFNEHVGGRNSEDEVAMQNYGLKECNEKQTVVNFAL